MFNVASTGQTEGQITRLKLLKRSMYGRAKFDLLRLHVLHRAEDSRKEKETARTVSQQHHDPASVPRSGAKRGSLQHTTSLILKREPRSVYTVKQSHDVT
jgi:hypothetical protein